MSSTLTHWTLLHEIAHLGVTHCDATQMWKGKALKNNLSVHFDSFCNETAKQVRNFWGNSVNRTWLGQIGLSAIQCDKPACDYTLDWQIISRNTWAQWTEAHRIGPNDVSVLLQVTAFPRLIYLANQTQWRGMGWGMEFRGKCQTAL